MAYLWWIRYHLVNMISADVEKVSSKKLLDPINEFSKVAEIQSQYIKMNCISIHYQ